MQINTKTVLKDFEGKDLIIDEKPLQISTVLIAALQHREQGLEATAEQTMRAYELGVMIMNNEQVELTSDDVVFIKTRLLKIYLPLIYGQVANILEGKTKPVAV